MSDDWHSLQRKIANACSCKKLRTGLGAEAHAVTFQPLKTRKNEDRVVLRMLEIAGEEWLFLGVCDGHGGSNTSRYTVTHLPLRICAALERLIESELQGQLDRENISEKADIIGAELKRCVMEFDEEFGHVVESICPEPAILSEKEAIALVKEYPDVLRQACSGCTLTAAVVNLRQRFMWAINVGDSTIALSTEDEDGKRTVHELGYCHSLYDRQEHERIVKSHPGEAQVVQHGRVLGLLAMSRALGDFTFKLNSEYSDKLFRFMSILGAQPIGLENVVSRLKSPPYVIAEPSIQFVDLHAVWHMNPVLVLFSDGVDNLIRHFRSYVNPGCPRDIVPSRAVAVLLQDEVDEEVEKILGYGIDLEWSGASRNRAVDVLGNLIGGLDTRILSTILDQDLLSDQTSSPPLYVDDTSLIVCSFTDLA